MIVNGVRISDQELESSIDRYDGMTAEPEDVLFPYRFIGKDKTIQSGNLVNNGSVLVGLNCGEYFTIPYGYHSGSGVITALDLASQTPGNVTPDAMIDGDVAWSNGKQVVGTIPSINPLIQSSYVYYSQVDSALYVGIDQGFYPNNNIAQINESDIASSVKIDAGNIAYGEIVFGKVGGYTHDATVTEDALRAGATAYVRGKKITGRMVIPTLY